MKENYTHLYGTGANGINEWVIWSDEDTIHIEANGSHYTATVETNQSGRSLQEQAKLQVEARVRVKMDSGFKRSRADLGKIITNQLGLAAPMLATPLNRAGKFAIDNCYVQPKLDGHRCLISSEGAYSRRGKVIDTIPEILKSVQVPDGAILDGELYAHGVHLQTIASWAKRRQEKTKNLRYHIYDIIVPDMSFTERQELLNQINYGEEYVTIVENQLFDTAHDPYDYCQYYRDNGYEGAILRPGAGKYEVGKRSKTLIKVKMRYDDEFRVVDIVPSADGWGILVLATAEGNLFRTSAPGNHEQKRKALLRKEDYIGKYVTCEYAELTKEKIPFHCVAIRWRNDL